MVSVSRWLMMMSGTGMEVDLWQVENIILISSLSSTRQLLLAGKRRANSLPFHQVRILVSPLFPLSPAHFSSTRSLSAFSLPLSYLPRTSSCSFSIADLMTWQISPKGKPQPAELWRCESMILSMEQVTLILRKGQMAFKLLSTESASNTLDGISKSLLI